MILFFILSLIPLSTVTAQFKQGTNVDARPYKEEPSFSLTGSKITTYNRAYLINKDARPEIGNDPECVYAYKHSLGDYNVPQTPINVIRPKDADTVLGDVRQGGIGNCGFGASILALVGNNQRILLRDVLKLYTSSPGIYFVVATFKSFVKGGTPASHPVHLDDSLPFLDTARSTGNCYPNLGYQGIPAQPNQVLLDVAFLEKAWAKYVNVYPILRSRGTTAKGYLGTTGANSSRVLEAFTGGQARQKRRAKGSTLETTVTACIINKVACTIGTPNVSSQSEYLEAAVNNRVLEISYRNNEEGELAYMIVKDPWNRNRQVILAGQHAYAIINSGSKATKDANGNKAILVQLANPWGCTLSNQSICAPVVSKQLLGRLVSEVNWAQT